MARAPYQVLVLPFFQDTSTKLLYAVFQRTDDHAWQGLSGGGESEETPLEAAVREAAEEAGIHEPDGWIGLDAHCSIPVVQFKDHASWGPDCYVIPEFAFGVRLTHLYLKLSIEHRAYRWLLYQQAFDLFEYDSNRTALWELNQRLLREQSAP